ncbi:hypothetical protein DNU06_00760 [Putridiphycobacter roseus]|uniref:TonB-dependent receptor plug domain-containing protein n=1 Tax=Putridiphycobacter roseus TaxID=2219161 RepID=A0A2W1N480_9FLAO|nr:TonB-dependent receptor plug domain-containing protein [Putridiphycobacter roseus]PZE18400.1 hypothetical protein DNU06_00760 [Putridiphycobacter roseus]
MKLLLLNISIAIGCPFIGFGQFRDTLKTVEIFAKADSIHTFSVINSAVPLYQFNAEKLLNIGVRDVGEALKQVPGANIKDYGGIGGVSTISFRSLGANHTSVELDDFILPSLQSGAVNLNQFNIFGVDKLALSTGQVQHNTASAAAYQKANLISIFSTIGSKPKYQTEIQAMGGYQTIQLGQIGLLIKQRINKKFTIGIQAMGREGQGAYTFKYKNVDSTYVAKRSASNLKNYQVRGVLQYHHKKQHLLLSSSWNQQSQKLPGAVILYNPFNHQFLSQNQTNTQLKYHFDNSKHYFGAQSFYRNGTTLYTDSAYLNSLGYLQNTYNIKEKGAGVMYRYFLGSKTQSVFIGSDFVSGSLNGSQYSATPHRRELISVIGFTKWLYRFKIQSNLTHQYIKDESLTQVNNYDKLSPLIAIAYLPFHQEKIRFRAHYKNTYRLPSFNDLYYNLIGNKNLQPENVTAINTGITYSKKWPATALEISIDAYQNQITNKIVAIPTQNLFNWSIQNIGNVKATGMDISLQILKKFQNFTVITNIGQNLNKSVDQTPENIFSYGHQIPYTPTYNATYNLALVLKAHYFNINMMHTGSRYTLNQNITENYLPGFIDLSISYSYKYSLKKYSDLSFYIHLNNIIGKNYEVIKSFPMPGRHVIFKLIFNLKK